MKKLFRYPTYVSLAVKNALIYFLLTMVGLAALGLILFRYSAREIITSSEQQLEEAANVVEVKFASFIKNAQRDVVYLAQSPFLHDFIDEASDRKRELLSAEYLALLKSKPDYAQIRLIGSVKNGREIIRANRLETEVVLVGDDELQRKGDRPYFVQALRLPKDSVFFSAIDLNKEYGMVSRPLMPTLRVATPVFREGTVFGIVIINVNLTPLFSELTKLAGENFDLKIVNQDGYFLLHPDREKTFGFDLEQAPAFEDDFGRSFAAVLPKVREQSILEFDSNELLYSFSSLYYPRPNYKLITAVGASKNAILANFYNWRRNILLATFLLTILIVLIILAYMQRQAGELKRITETMTAYPVQANVAKLPIDRNDEIGQLARQFSDMSKSIDEYVAALQEAKRTVEQAVQEKEMFLENMSHEIRNPIHSMIGMTHLLEKNQPGRHQEAFISALKFNAESLMSLVNDILDFKKISSGELVVRPEWLKLEHFMQQVMQSHQFAALKKKIKLTVELSPKLADCLVFVDPVRLTQIINNLLINALKFTPENGAVSLNVSVLDVSADQMNLRMQVADTGVGISETEIKQIVERYYSQETKPNGIAPEGTGLGLPIVTHLLQLLGSQLQIESVVGEGSTFSFDLKVQCKAVAKDRQRLLSGMPVEVLAKARVLIVEDDELVVLLYRNLLEDICAKLTFVRQLDDLTEVAAHYYDILIADLNFGQESITDHEETLVKKLQPSGLLFVLSGVDEPPVSISNLPQFAGHLRKPVNPEQLLEQLIFAYAEQEFGTPDLSLFAEDYDHDAVKLQRVIGLLLSEWTKMREELKRAIVENDRKAYVAIRHKLITSVRRLKLARFEAVLDEPIVNELVALDATLKARIEMMMAYYIWWLQWKS